MIFSSEHPSYPVTFPSSTVSSLEKARAALLCHEQMVQEDPVPPSQHNHPLVSKTRAYCEPGGQIFHLHHACLASTFPRHGASSREMRSGTSIRLSPWVFRPHRFTGKEEIVSFKNTKLISAKFRKWTQISTKGCLLYFNNTQPTMMAGSPPGSSGLGLCPTPFPVKAAVILLLGENGAFEGIWIFFPF